KVWQRSYETQDSLSWRGRSHGTEFPVSPQPTIQPFGLRIPMMSQSVERVFVLPTSSIVELNSIASTSTGLYWPPVAASSVSHSSSVPCTRGWCCHTQQRGLYTQ